MKIQSAFIWMLRKLGVEIVEEKVDPNAFMAIPFEEARLCLNCEYVVRSQRCPICGSERHLLLGKILGLMKSKRNSNG